MLKDMISNPELMYQPTIQEGAVVDEMFSVLMEYNVPFRKAYEQTWESWGVNRELRALFANKGWILERMKNHPLYNGNFQLVIPDAYMGRGIDYDSALQAMGEIMNHRRLKMCFRDINDSHELFIRSLENKIYSLINMRAGYIIPEKYIEPINALFESNGKRIRMHRGQSITKLLARYAECCPEITKWKVDKDCSFYDTQGNFHPRKKDMGWNGLSAIIGDSLNPINRTETMVISIHPVDYLLMSNGDKWRSCHAIGKFEVDKANAHNGCYMGGCLSYLQDACSVVVYYIPKAETNNPHPECLGKLKRMMVYLDNGKIIMSRLYPDGRDSKDTGNNDNMTNWMRKKIQQVVSELFDMPNEWDVKFGKEEVCEYITHEGVQYPDYMCFDDVSISIHKDLEGEKFAHKNLHIGRYPICPICGNFHKNEMQLVCPDCLNKYNIPW